MLDEGTGHHSRGKNYAANDRLFTDIAGVNLISTTGTVRIRHCRMQQMPSLEWNEKAGEIVVKAGLGPLPAERALAMVQASVYEAVNAITQRYPVSDLKLETASGASVEAAVAAANRVMLTKLVPSQQAIIDHAYQLP